MEINLVPILTEAFCKLYAFSNNNNNNNYYYYYYYYINNVDCSRPLRAKGYQLTSDHSASLGVACGQHVELPKSICLSR